MISLAELTPVDFESELRVARAAVRQMEQWLSENGSTLVRIGLVSAADMEGSPKVKMEEDRIRIQDAGESRNIEEVSLEQLEQLAVSASQLALEFPIRRYRCLIIHFLSKFATTS